MEGVSVVVHRLYLFHIYSALSCPGGYYCDPTFSLRNSKACVMEKGFISKEFYVKKGIRQGAVDLHQCCSAFSPQDCQP